MAQKQYLMGVDIGTYESKGAIVDLEGNVVLLDSEKHGMENPKPNYYEHDAEQVWWHDLYTLTSRLLEKSGIGGEQIAALGVSTLGTCCLPVDRDLKPLRKAILYGIDARSQKEIEFLTQYYGEEKVKELFGRPIVSGDVCAKILWIKNNEPEVYARTYKFLTGTSYLVAKLTGNFVLDRFLGIASLRPLYHMDGRIREEMCDLFCRPDQLPEGHVVTDIAGTVTAEAAKATGLLEGTPVIVGTGDSSAEAISTGVIHPGDVMVQFGSSVFIYCCTEKLITDDRVRGNSFVIPNTYSIAAGTNNCGTITKWFRDNLYPEAVALEEQGGPNAYETMMAEVEKIPVGSGGLVTLPYFAGERTPINDPNARGADDRPAAGPHQAPHVPLRPGGGGLLGGPAHRHLQGERHLPPADHGGGRRHQEPGLDADGGGRHGRAPEHGGGDGGGQLWRRPDGRHRRGHLPGLCRPATGDPARRHPPAGRPPARGVPALPEDL